MSKTITAPEPEAVSVNVPAAPMAAAVETVATPEPVAVKAPASKAAAKKPPVKRAVKPAAKAIKAAQPAAAVDTEKTAKTDALPPPAKPVKESKAKKIVPKKPKLVRDSFTFPENDYALPAALSQPAISSLLGIRPATLTASSTTKAGVVMIG